MSPSNELETASFMDAEQYQKYIDSGE
jgi:hypothetical protein